MPNLMHEWALAESVVETIRKYRKEQASAKVGSITVCFGELQKIDPDIFRTGLEMLLQNEDYGPELFITDIEKASFRCLSCDKEWPLDESTQLKAEEKEAIHFLPELAHTYMQCPQCKSPDFKLSKGRGVTIREILLEEDD